MSTRTVIRFGGTPVTDDPACGRVDINIPYYCPACDQKMDWKEKDAHHAEFGEDDVHTAFDVVGS